MPRLTIDNIPVEVPAGTSVLEAAKQVGIWIPHFCYHPALGSVGACRLCAMKFLEGPVKGVQMSCMIPAQDGMVVSTTDGEAYRMRQLVIEWLMINHPHDCPVCDEGGECLLQDYTIAGGHGIRRYQGKKRTFNNQFLGPYIEHEMNRCIECYRCARFYQDFAGGSDFGVMGSAGRVYFGRFQDGPLQSPFSGNLVDICPTGVFTDKTARFRARYWDYQMAPSICPHCSLGCNTIPAARYRELLKIMARRNDAVNGWFICDRGRFEKSPVNDPARPRSPRIAGGEAGWDQALDALVGRIGEVAAIHGRDSIALVGSTRLPLEGLVMLPRLAEALGTATLCFFTETKEAERTMAAVRRLTPSNAASMADVQAADGVIVMACDLPAEGAMMALAVRQAWRKGAQIFAVEGGGEALTAELGVAVTGAASLAQVPLGKFKNPVIICGTGRADPATIEAAADTGAKVAFILPGANAFAAARLSAELGVCDLRTAVAGGKIKGIIAFEADVAADLLANLPLIAAADYLPSDLMVDAAVFLPATTTFEADGTFVNNEGRAQRFKKVMEPGVPVKGLDPALHPPHVHRLSPPGGEVFPSWQIIAALIERLGGVKIVEPLSGPWEKLRHLNADGGGVSIL
ncbi:NADH-quinone oxidoreductase subunit NuoG [Geotalea sp. SG265]|uniref:NADH-quinone oxidoreductase subunit NuoG n=1 Tax=Geotalea sp. SG265 TaxID=2922867 RepID=UPI001FB0334A|nr:NADH-quinone oxidoreductase subunit NuoG [Geotalea sp. SG265]